MGRPFTNRKIFAVVGRVLDPRASIFHRSKGIVASGNHRNSLGNRHLLGGGLVTEIAQIIDGGTNEDDAIVVEGLGKVSILGEQSITRMNGFDFIFRTNLYDVVDIEVGGDWSLVLVEKKGLVCLVTVLGETIYADKRNEEMGGEVLAKVDKMSGGSLSLETNK